MVYVSVRGRIWLQAEAMNMVESVGNYVKHRKVPILVKKQNQYITFFVPAISGESIAHSYQQVLAQEMLNANEKVCPLCSKGVFLKSTNSEVYKATTGKEPPKAQSSEAEGQSSGRRRGSTAKRSVEDLLKIAKEIEESIIQSCGVEDVGGFLYAEEPNVKRTSNFYTGYMIPVYEVVDLASIDPQLHSRYALGTKFISATQAEGGEGGKAAGQMIYYVEVASALFTFSFDIDTSMIGKYTYLTSEYGKPVPGVDPVKRAKVALNALARFLLEFPVGAKRTRFNPSDLRWESIGLAVADDVFTMPSSFTSDYLFRAVSKRKTLNKNVEIYAFSEGGCAQQEIKCFSSPEEAITKAIEDAVKRIK